MLTMLFVSVYACAASECVCVLASTVDNWLLCRVGGFALCSLEHRGGWPLLPVVPLPGYCFDGIPECIGFPSNS